MKLSEMIACTEEMTRFRCVKPDAAKDSNYEIWEVNMTRTAKIVSSLVENYLLSKEAKANKVKKPTVCALKRRWKNMTYPVPTEDDLKVSREKAKYLRELTRSS
jgi:hypothetical protein